MNKEATLNTLTEISKEIKTQQNLLGEAKRKSLNEGIIDSIQQRLGYIRGLTNELFDEIHCDD